MQSAQHQAPPSDWRGIARQLGPGLIISANIVGSGELIVTTNATITKTWGKKDV
jgi:Mn2+/Fe2+ NRAMP family transporter